MDKRNPAPAASSAARSVAALAGACVSAVLIFGLVIGLTTPNELPEPNLTQLAATGPGS